MRSKEMRTIYLQRIIRVLIVLSAIALSNHVFSQARGGGDGAKPEVEAAAKKEAGKGAKQEARKQALNR